MSNHVSFAQKAGAELIRGGARKPEFPTLLPSAGDQLQPRGRFYIELWRGGKRVHAEAFNNGITNEGKNFLLNVMFHGTTAITTWYLGLIDNSSFTALAAADIYTNINQAGNGWHEFTSYTDNANASSAVTRPIWNEDASSGQAITNSSVAIFDITGSGTVKGVFLAGGGPSPSTKGDHDASASAKLWATALFGSGDVAVLNGDQLKVTYTVSA
jgi:hypothetical protein